MPPTGDQACNLAFCPDWESNQWNGDTQPLSHAGGAIMLSFMTKGYCTFPTEMKVQIKQMNGLQYCFSSVVGSMGKAKADFELSPCSVKTLL